MSLTAKLLALNNADLSGLQRRIAALRDQALADLPASETAQSAARRPRSTTAAPTFDQEAWLRQLEHSRRVTY